MKFCFRFNDIYIQERKRYHKRCKIISTISIGERSQNRTIGNDRVFKAGLKNFTVTTTAYPIDPTFWARYRTEPTANFFDGIRAFSLYVHIPFCPTVCSFCEYVRMRDPGAEFKERYVAALIKELEMKTQEVDFGGKLWMGFDIGGGTPTTLNGAQLARITEAAQQSFKEATIPNTFKPSIETTGSIASTNREYLTEVRQLGFRRISMGMQATTRRLKALMNIDDRNNSLYFRAVDNLRSAGFDLINLDLMYGLSNQSEEDLRHSLLFATQLEVDHITLYEMRYHFSNISSLATKANRERNSLLYRLAFDCLNDAGYKAPFGRNTFSKLDDKGLSSYLESRTVDFVPYIGIGAGSQTQGSDFISYNIGKRDKNILGYMEAIEIGHSAAEDFYRLPKEEQIAKYVAISFYLGYIEMGKLSQRLGINFEAEYRSEIDYLRLNGLAMISNGILTLTQKGFENYNGVVPLFYPLASKEYIVKGIDE